MFVENENCQLRDFTKLYTNGMSDCEFLFAWPFKIDYKNGFFFQVKNSNCTAALQLHAICESSITKLFTPPIIA